MVVSIGDGTAGDGNQMGGLVAAQRTRPARLRLILQDFGQPSCREAAAYPFDGREAGVQGGDYGLVCPALIGFE
jgi:hypothetical protein